jgi:uncharacterized protein with NRDE domain
MMPPRSKAKMYDLVNRIVQLYNDDKKSVKEIEKILREEGFDISKSSIHRTIKSYTELANEYKKTAEETKALIEELRKTPATYTMEAILTMLTNKIFHFVRSIESMDFDEPDKLVMAMNKLASSIEKVQRYREEIESKMRKIEAEAEKKNIDRNFIEIIKNELYGI